MAEKESFFSKLNETIKERTYSPFLIYFVISWIYYNHAVIIYLCDKTLDADAKLKHIDPLLNFHHLFVFPLWAATILFFIWCFIHIWTSACWDFVRQFTKSYIKKNIRKIPVVAESELDKKDAELQARGKDYDRIIIDKESRINILSNEILALKESNKQLDGASKYYKNQIESSQVELNKIKKSYGMLYAQNQDDSEIKATEFRGRKGEFWCTFVNQESIGNAGFKGVVLKMNGNAQDYTSESVQFTRVIFPKTIDLDIVRKKFSDIGFQIDLTVELPDDGMTAISDIAKIKDNKNVPEEF